MVVCFDVDEMSKEELKDAVREYDHTPARNKLFKDYNYSQEQLSALSKGTFKEKWGEE